MVKKILFISSEFPPGPGGIGNHAWNLSRSLNNQIHVDVLTVSDYTDESASRSFDDNTDFNIFRFKRYPFAIKTYFHRIFQIIRHIRKNNYSHCIVSGYFALSTCSIIRLLNKKIIIIGILHGSELIQPKVLYKLILKISLKCLDVMISVSSYTNSKIPIKTDHNQKSIVIPNGVDNKMLNIIINKNDTIKLSGNPCLLTVGSITHRKGQINLINALPEIINKYPNVHYHCVGLPLEGEDILRSADRINVEKYVSIHGFIQNNQLSSIYKQADILIMLSQNKINPDVEGFGIAILEANLFGVPALGSINTGIEDAIAQYQTGALVNPYSKKEIVDGIDWLLQRKNELSQKTVDWAFEHSWSNISKRYLKVIIDD